MPETDATELRFRRGLKVVPLIPSHRYRLRWRHPAQRLDREAVWSFLGDAPDDHVSFSARPLAGTQTMPRDWIVDLTEVPKDTPISLPRVRKPVREPTPAEPLLHRVAKAALEGAGAAIGDDLEQDYWVELIEDDRLQRGYRITDRTGRSVPRYVRVRVEESALPNPATGPDGLGPHYGE